MQTQIYQIRMRAARKLRTWSRIGLILLSAATIGTVSGQTPHAYDLAGALWGTHDPSIIKHGDTWYVFATGKAADGGQFTVRCSKDLQQWKICGHVFDNIPDWIHKESPGTVDLWAPHHAPAPC